MTVVSPRIDDKILQINVRGSELQPDRHELPRCLTRGFR